MIHNTKISVLTGLTFLALLMLSGLSFIAAQAQVYPEPKGAALPNQPHIEGAGPNLPPMFMPNVAQVPAKRDSISLSPVADTYVISGRPDQEWGDEDWFRVGYDPITGYEIQRTLLKFDVSEIPVETHINSATLSLFMWQARGDGKMSIEVYRLGSAWGEDVTWNQHTDLLVDATPVAVSEVSTQSGWYEWDVSALLQEWVDDPSSNFGIILKGDESVGLHGRAFWSRGCDSAKCESSFPKLSVEFGVATPTPTDTPTPTATNSPTPTHTPGSPPTDTPTPNIPSSGGDDYENDDSCAQASPIPTDGTIQRHNFHQSGDTDWVRFEGTAGTVYQVEAQVPAASLANVSLVIYDQCGGTALDNQNYAFSPTVRMQFTAPSDGVFFLELYNDPPEVAGSNVSYNLSVRALSESGTAGALIIVAGRLKSNDPLQENIHFVSDAVYDLFREHDYTDDDINYLATESNLDGFDASATKKNLQSAITTWARDRVGPDRALTLYLIDHGGQNQLYLDKPRGERVTPDELDRWLSDLEAAQPGVKVNVIIEASYSGSFIEGSETISGPGRVVITSTGADNLAWASNQGTLFSDHFLAALRRKSSLYTSFQEAREAVESTRRPQTPWLDGDGDGIPNEADDVEEAATRGLADVGTFCQPGWPPYIAEVAVSLLKDGRAEIKSQVLDDTDVDQVSAVIYPPSYEAPEASEELIEESLEESLETSLLVDQGDNSYKATYSGFNERGTYQIVIYAKDADGLKARPVTIEVKVEPDPPLGVYQLYLPIAIR